MVYMVNLQLLLHHVIPGAFRIDSLQDEMTGVSLAGTQLRVNEYAMHDHEWNDIKVCPLLHRDLVIPDYVIVDNLTDLNGDLSPSILIFGSMSHNQRCIFTALLDRSFRVDLVCRPSAKRWKHSIRSLIMHNIVRRNINDRPIFSSLEI